MAVGVKARAEAEVRVARVGALIIRRRVLGEVPILHHGRPSPRPEVAELCLVVDIGLPARLAQHAVDGRVLIVLLKVEEVGVAFLEAAKAMCRGRPRVSRGADRRRGLAGADAVGAREKAVEEREHVAADGLEFGEAVRIDDLDAEVGRAVVDPHRPALESHGPPGRDAAICQPRILILCPR